MSDRPTHLPAHWASASVSELTEFVTSGSRGWAKYYAPSGPLFLRVGNLDHDTVDLDLDDTVCVDPPEGAEGARTAVREGDILLSITAEVGMVGLARPSLGDAYVNQHVALIRPLPPVWSPGLAYAFLDPQGLQALARDAQYGATKQGLSLIQVRGFRVALPPLPEQHRIVEAIESYFTRLDDAVATLVRIQRNLKRYRASVLKAAVEGRLLPTEAELAQTEDRDYEPASVLLDRILAERRRRWEEAELAKMKAKGKQPKNDMWKAKYKEPVAPDTTDLPELPEGWCWAGPDEIAAHEDYSLGIGPFGSNLKVSDYQEEGVPLIFVRNIRSEAFGGTGTKYVASAKAIELTPHIARGGDLLITKMGEPPGDVAIYPAGSPDAVITADCIRLRHHTYCPSTRFLMYAMRSHVFRGQIVRVTKGVAQKKVSLRRFKSTAVPLAPKEEQGRVAAEIDRLLSVAEAALRIAEREERRCRRLREATLRWAFEGKLADQDPNDEPAATLLERIQAEKSRQPKKVRRGRGRAKSMAKKGIQAQRDLVPVLIEAGGSLRPEELLGRAGYSPDSVGAFYEKLRAAVRSGAIRESRPDNRSVLLEISPE